MRKIRALYGRRGTFIGKGERGSNLRMGKSGSIDNYYSEPSGASIQSQNQKQRLIQDEEEYEIENNWGRIPAINKDRDKSNYFKHDLPEDATIFHRLIIHPDSNWKSFFDVFILGLVLVSCITNMLFVTFPIKNEFFQTHFFWGSECFFYLDFIFCWFQGYKHPFNQNNVMEFRLIARNYLRGWFIIDIICIAPIQLISQDQKDNSIKLLRLPRLLRMFKLMNIKTIKRLLK